MCPIYTREGDEGFTHLLGKGQYPKNDPRLECLGAIDEANSALGLARSQLQSAHLGDIILRLQRDLYRIMTEIAASPDHTAQFPSTNRDQVSWIESQISDLEEKVRPPEDFILPGDSTAGAALDMARTIIRRAERRLLDLVQQGLVANPELLHYFNRLSSLCFIMELDENNAVVPGKTTLAKTGDSE